MKKIMSEAIRFGLVGVINTVMGYVIIMVLYHVFHWNYWGSSVTSYIIGGTYSYFANRKFTFKTTEKGWKPALRFAANIAICYVIAYGCARPFVRSMMEGYSTVIVENIAILFGTGFFIVLNFLGQKFLVFGKEKENVKTEEPDKE